MNETLPDDLKADFDRLQAEMDAFEQYFQKVKSFKQNSGGFACNGDKFN
jgi:hypothetical protein